MPNSASLVLFSRSPPRIVRVRGALKFMDEVGWGRLWLSVQEDLAAFISEASSSDCDIVGVDTSACTQPVRSVGVVGEVRRVAPTKPILFLASSRELGPREWLAASEAGAAEFALDEEDTAPVAIARLIRSISGISLAVRVIRSLEGHVPTQWVRMLERALVHSRRANLDDTGLSASSLADVWNSGSTAAQLAWYLQQDGAWTPGWIVRWLICLKALSLRAVRPSWTAVATGLGFSQRSDLRAYVQRFSGLREDQLTEDGLREAFLRQGRGWTTVDRGKRGMIP